ncbi:dihydrofolate reductase family protein [Oceanobacillus sp. 1P07AA]|uniref:dihydrofolate reductase family protein n=1 Tax=Oceanobacillus sp. 1P07AA TaxID=3132293 RepID=UPI0039A6BFFF
MGKVYVDISMSLDGYITGKDDSTQQPLGIGGESLQNWMFQGSFASEYNDFFTMSEVNRRIFDHPIRSLGAMMIGKRTFDIVNGWNGSHPISGIPIVVVTHEPPNEYAEEDTTFHFVSGIHKAMDTARQLAEDKEISIGTASIAQQCLAAKLVDELHLHIAPVLLGDGKNLFARSNQQTPLKLIKAIDGDVVTHLFYQVIS